MSDHPEASGDGAPGPPAVGIVGAGQLARMTCEAAGALGIRTVVLADHSPSAAAPLAAEVLAGSPWHEDELRHLAGACQVLTFDHEQVDLDLLRRLEEEGRPAVRPGTVTLDLAVDKARMRTELHRAGVPVPAFRVLEPAGGDPEGAAALEGVEGFAADHGWPVVLKAVRGGYDGKGVWPVTDAREAAEVCRSAAGEGTSLLVEAMVPIVAEMAVVVARRPGGESVAWPVVETTQVEGVCREVLLPGRVGSQVVARADALGRQVAAIAGAVGVLAVELFWTGTELVVNELAARPHNSGHWTQDGSVTSQFENHLRAVLDLPLGATTPTAPAVASVNVFGPPDGSDPSARLAGALAVAGAHVHLYGKEARPGRKLGHVTVCGDQLEEVRERAWAAALALGTPPIPGTPEGALTASASAAAPGPDGSGR